MIKVFFKGSGGGFVTGSENCGLATLSLNGLTFQHAVSIHNFIKIFFHILTLCDIVVLLFSGLYIVAIFDVIFK